MKLLAFLILLLMLNGLEASADELQRLPYNNPGLAVDLGVGLWAWPIPCDADYDGDYDLIVSCPDKPSNGVWLFENSTGDTSTNKFPIFKAARLISKTHPYVMPSYVDGKLRVLSPAGEYKSFSKKGIQDVVPLPVDINFHKLVGKQSKGPGVRHQQWRYVDFDGDGALDLIAAIEDWSDYGWDNAWDEHGIWKNGPLHGFVYLFRNSGSTTTPMYDEPQLIHSDGQPMDVYGCPSPNFEDFDGDGDLDLICGEFLDQFTYFENNGTRKEPKYAKGVQLKQSKGQALAMDLQMIVPIAFDWDRDGDCDLIVGDEDGRVALVENVDVSKFEAGSLPQFLAPKYFQQEADTLKCGALATPYAVDWDADGDIDILSGNTAGYIEYFENLSGPRISSPKWNRPVRVDVDGKPFRILAGSKGSIQGPAEAKWGYTTFNVGDWDGDGLQDVVLNSILGDVVWLRNVGTRNQPRLPTPQPIRVEWDSEQPKLAWGRRHPKGDELLTQWRTTPLVHDFDQDGLVDLAMLDHEGYLAFFKRKKINGELVLSAPRLAFVDTQGNPLRLNNQSAGRSGRRKLCVCDWDGDGKFDLLVNSTSANYLRQVDYKDHCWVMQDLGALVDQNIEGHDVSPTTADFDGDRVSDFIGGAEDGRFYYLKNPRSAIVKSEFIYETASFPSCHASSIVELPSGDLMATWFGGTHEKHPDVGIWISRFEDSKWSSPQEVANGVKHADPHARVERYPTWNPVLFQPVSANASEPLFLYYKVGPSPQTWWGMMISSSDGGKSWTEPQRLPDGILGPIKNKSVQLSDGTLLSASSTESDEEDSKWQVHFERSSDVGKSWGKIGPVNDGVAIEAIQPSVLTLGKDHLLAIGRTRQDRIFEVESTDAGRSWGAMRLGTLPNNNSGIDAVTMKDGRHAIVYNHVGGTPGEWGGKRSPLNLSISQDGHEWQAALVLESDPGEYSYPAIIQTSDGLLHITYTWQRQRIKHVVVDPSHLVLRKLDGINWPVE